MSPHAACVWAAFEDFWAHLRRAREAGTLQPRIIHRVCEEWPFWWAHVGASRQEQLRSALSQLTAVEHADLRQRLAILIEHTRDPKPGGRGAESPAEEGAADWVFMQFGHIPVFEGTALFDAWRLDHVNGNAGVWTGFNMLCVEPDEPFPIIVVPVVRGPRAEPDYCYNAILDHPAGMACARSAVNAVLVGNPFMFAGRPRGISHLPATLRIVFLGLLVLSPSALAILYIAVYTGHASSGLVDVLMRMVLAGAVLLPALWLLAMLSDGLIGWQLAKRLHGSQIAWALGRRLPDATSRNPLRIDGESYGAALALSMLWSLVRRDEATTWISWLIRRAGERAAHLVLLCYKYVIHSASADVC
jgi:hypothetical protein